MPVLLLLLVDQFLELGVILPRECTVCLMCALKTRQVAILTSHTILTSPLQLLSPRHLEAMMTDRRGRPNFRDHIRRQVALTAYLNLKLLFFFVFPCDVIAPENLDLSSVPCELYLNPDLVDIIEEIRRHDSSSS